jgi:hypothetical protein
MWVRRTVATLAVILGLAVFAPRVGERDRTEAYVVGVLRAIVSGEMAYASTYGYYGTLACLASASCVPDARIAEPAFLSPDLAAAKERRGYRLEFHEGPRAPAPSDSLRSRPRMTAFAVVAFPVNPGAGKRRSFCADDRQLIYVTPEPSIPRVEAGRCVDTANLLH